MRLNPVAILIYLVCLTSLAWAQAEGETRAGPAIRKRDREAQMVAAKADAIASLRQQILAANVRQGLSVADLIDRIGGAEELDKTLNSSARLIGGTRWLDDETVQIRVAIGGTDVAKSLLRIAESNPKALDVPVARLREELGDVRGMTFSATGTSTRSEDLANFAPRREDPVVWLSVTDEERRRAVDEARMDAATGMAENFAGVEVAQGKTIADALAVPEVRHALCDWLADQPVVDMVYGKNLEVRITLAAPGDELWTVFRGALEKQDKVPRPTTEAEWDRLRERVFGRAGAGVGRGTVEGDHVGAAAAEVDIPSDPPDWVFEEIEGVGSAKGAPNLLTARRAEDAALEQLRSRVSALELSRGTSLGDAAERDPRVRAVVERSLNAAVTPKVNYGDDGVEVRKTLDLQRLWRRLEMLGGPPRS